MIDRHEFVGDREAGNCCQHTTWHGPNVVSICSGPWWDPIHTIEET